MKQPPKTISGGLVVVFEGLDGVGKTTQLQLSKQDLEADGWLVYSARSHGGTPIGEQLRKVSHAAIHRPPLTDVYISLAMHAALAEELAVQRRRGAIILIDRGQVSSIAYQLYGDNLLDIVDWSVIEADMQTYNSELTLIFEAPVDVALARAKSKPGGNADYFGSKSTDYFQRVNQGYQDAARRYNLPIIDSNRPAAIVQADTIQAIKAAIKSKLNAT